MSDHDCDCCFRRHALFRLEGYSQIVIDGTDGRAWFPQLMESGRYEVTEMDYFDPAMGFQEIDPQSGIVTTILTVRLNVSDSPWVPHMYKST